MFYSGCLRHFEWFRVISAHNKIRLCQKATKKGQSTNLLYNLMWSGHLFAENSSGISDYGSNKGKWTFHTRKWTVVLLGLQSKRPQVKTSPSQNVPELVKTSPKIGQNVPMVKNVGQNVPKMIFYSIFFVFLGIIWDF